MQTESKAAQTHALSVQHIMTFLLAMVVAVALLITAGCGNKANQGGQDTKGASEQAQPAADTNKDNKQADNAGPRKVTDLAGRTVEIPAEVNKIIGVGSSSLRYIVYMDAADKVVGVEEAEHEYQVGKAYAAAEYDKFKDLPIIGKGGAGGVTPFEEEILKVKPEVIIASLDKDTAQSLQDKVKIPVVCIIGADSAFAPEFSDSMKLLGEVLHKEDRATELLSFVDSVKKDFDKRVGSLTDAEKKTAYPAGVSFRGGHGFSGTEGNHSPFMIANVKNISDGADHKGPFDMDPEKVLEAQPEFIFIDCANLGLVQDDYAQKPALFQQLKAVQDGNVYSEISFRWYATNVELALADAYYVGKMVYPDKFEDVDVVAKFDEITKAFVGKPLYADYEADGKSFRKLDISAK